MTPWIETDHHRVFFRLGSSPYAVVTFSHLEYDWTSGSYWGKAIADALDLTCVGVVAKGPNWFPRADFETFAPRIRAALADFGEVLTFGVSMGGYGALLHGDAVGASAAIAFSPLASIDPALAPFDPRYRAYFHAESMSGERVGSLPPSAFVTYDPHHPWDAAHVDMIAAGGSVCRIKTPMMDHATGSMLDTALAKSLFEAARAGDDKAMTHAIRPRRREALIYYQSVAHWGLNLKRSRRWATLALREGLARYPDDPRLNLLNDQLQAA